MLSFEEAKMMHERGQIPEAIAAYDALLNRQFGHVEILFYYGTALFQQGKTGLAATVLKQVIDTAPKMQSAYQNLGNCFKMEQRKEPWPHGCNPRLAHCEIHAGPEVIIEIENGGEPDGAETKDPEVADFDQMA